MDSSTQKMTQSGIYSIVSMVTGHTYVGQAVDIPGRWRSHRCLLRKGKHFNIRLQRAWNKEGADSFTWSVLEYVPRDAEALEKAEQFWADYQKACGKTLYNFGGFTRNPNFGQKMSEEARRKIGDCQRGRKRGPRSPETIEKIRQANIGKKRSEAVCQRMSAARKGKKMPPRTKEHIAKLPQCQAGRKVPETARRRMSEAGKLYWGRIKEEGLPAGSEKPIRCVQTGKVYRSGREAARELGLNFGLISEVVLGRRARTGGYSFEYFHGDQTAAA